MTLCQLPDYVKTPDSFGMMMEKFRGAELKSYGRLVNGFVEIEEEYKEHYQKIMGYKIYHLGPSFLVNKTDQEKSERGMKSMVSDHECLDFLNSKPPNSVVYICFGSSCFFSDTQLHEIASGIESSGHPFIWVVFRKDQNDEDDQWLPMGFKDRVMKRERRGMIIKGWAPQALILEHEATGGFLSHCGWNSVMEGICAGVPTITWPLTAEQFYNEKLITQVHGIGVEVGSEEWTVTAGHERKKVVSRDRIEKAVKKIMDVGDEAEQMRKRVKELEKKAKAAVEESGSSQKNLTLLIEDLGRNRAERKATVTRP
ncbi:UDP-glucose flavonoid 3-O-glucosyltransferase 7-like [Neltuma alba]|nr:UDP-glucose flavonoid 3-O-glucosyltransferase 7-like [Prosopis alba]